MTSLVALNGLKTSLKLLSTIGSTVAFGRHRSRSSRTPRYAVVQHRSAPPERTNVHFAAREAEPGGLRRPRAAERRDFAGDLEGYARDAGRARMQRVDVVLLR
ncbi:hypothetical protein A0H81_14950 [Grifola frondosa]|uniref:Uncharacterized protein n=1 Tax=Grifola frondosa TaxID=5627 RepID=A0A1C7LJV7_GRIFR|nr:hypothetical protein A0H81_14950 [Grifola frondosa]